MNRTNLALKLKMLECNITQKDLMARWRRSQTYITRRMNGLESFTVEEVQDLVQLLHIESVSEFFRLFFPSLKLAAAREA